MTNEVSPTNQAGGTQTPLVTKRRKNLGRNLAQSGGGGAVPHITSLPGSPPGSAPRTGSGGYGDLGIRKQNTNISRDAPVDRP